MAPLRWRALQGCGAGARGSAARAAALGRRSSELAPPRGSAGVRGDGKAAERLVGAGASAASTAPAGRRGPSLFERELQRCADSAAVLRVGSSTRLPLGPDDLQAFLGRLGELGRMPQGGAALHRFVAKVEAALPACGIVGAQLAVVRFAELRCRQGALAAWPLLLQGAGSLGPNALAEGVWAGAVVPNPPPALPGEVAELARRLAPQLARLPDALLSRCLYGLARLPRAEGLEAFRRAAERAVLAALGRPGPCAFTPAQLVRLCWALARLGAQRGELFGALEPRLRNVVGALTDRELQALYSILTSLKLVGQWRLIHDVERAMEARWAEGPVGDPNKAPRKKPFRRKWTRPTLLTPVVRPGGGAGRRGR